MIKKPSIIHWLITSKCNLNCDFCFANKNKDLSTKDCFKIIDKISALGIKKLVISGGEPLIKKDILKILNYAKKKGFNIRLDTNGILLPKFINRLKIDALGISLDGPDAETDQKMRNYSRHFEKVIESLEKLKGKNMKVVIHTLVTKINYSKITELAKLLDQYKIYKWSLFEFCPYGKAFKNIKKYQISQARFAALEKKINFKGKTDFCQFNDRVKAYFFITSDGNIYTPHKQDTEKYQIWGNIFEKDPKDFFKEITLNKNKKRSLIY